MEFLTTELLNGTGVVTLVVAFALALARGWLVTAREHNAVMRDRDEWKAYALRGLRVAERGTEVAEVTAQALDRLPDPGRQQ